MADRMQLKGRAAIITGAASGIGRAVAQSLARRGCHLALADVNEAGLEETARSCATGTRITYHRLDVSEREAIAAFPAVVRGAHGGIDLLVNNAGVAVGGTFEQVAEADFDWLIAINFFGVVRMTRAFLPMLKASDDARIVNISSIFGIIAPPGQTAYCASKFALRGFSESLRHELKGTHVGVTVVHPGGVATSIARNARVPQTMTREEFRAAVGPVEAQLKLPPDAAAETIVGAVERRQPRVIVGSDAKFAAMIERMAPVAHWEWLQRLRARAQRRST
jgi:NAD(P)-dependent dehydrogenase (short-subunit alcohol dehydrogenase family)